MPFIKTPLKDAAESQTVPDGLYELLCGEATIHHNERSGKDSVMIPIAITDPPDDVSNPSDIMHFLPLLREDDSEKGRAFKLVLQARFLVAFNIPFEDNGFDTDDISGAGGKVAVTTDTDDNDVPRNVLNLPELETE